MTNLPFTLRQLEIFEALSRTQSFRLAAEQLAISQAAVSNHIKALEQQLGIALFVRRAGRPPQLSLEGLAFTRDLAPFLETAQRLAAHRRAAVETAGARAYKVYIGQHLLENYIRPKLDEFLMANPGVELDFVSDTPSPDYVRQILSDKFDIALFHAMPGQKLDEHCRVIAHCRAGVFAHRRLLPADDHELSLEEVSELPYVLTQTESKEDAYSYKQLMAAGIRPSRVVARVQYHDVVAKWVERGVGASNICESFIQVSKRDELKLVHPFAPWRLAVRRTPDLTDPLALQIEDLLTTCVLEDGRYPAV